VFDFLAMAARLLETGIHPDQPLLWAARWAPFVEQARVPNYINLLTSTTLRYFEILAGSQIEPRLVQSYGLTLAIVLGVIRNIDSAEFRTLRDALAARCHDLKSDSGREILAEVEGLLAEVAKGQNGS
jgi:hypothetical protein